MSLTDTAERVAPRGQLHNFIIFSTKFLGFDTKFLVFVGFGYTVPRFKCKFHHFRTGRGQTGVNNSSLLMQNHHC